MLLPLPLLSSERERRNSDVAHEKTQGVKYWLLLLLFCQPVVLLDQ